jgi:hypothetical protein
VLFQPLKVVWGFLGKIVMAGAGMPPVALLCVTTITSLAWNLWMEGSPKYRKKIIRSVSWMDSLAPLRRHLQMQVLKYCKPIFLYL